MAELWHSFNPTQNGWYYMWVLAIVGAFMIAVALERAYFIYVKSNIDSHRFMQQIRQLIKDRDYKRAIDLCKRYRDKALPFIVLACLTKANSLVHGEGSKTEKHVSIDFRDIQNAVDEGTLEMLPKLQKRTHYLALIGNIATLLGLMGTIYGLIIAFQTVGGPGIDVADKSRRLAQGIAVAMNTTLLGLAIAIPSITIHHMLQSKTTRIIDDIDEHMVKLINLITTGK